jgi:type II secretory pathway component PulK
MVSKRARPGLRASEGSVLIQVLWTLAILVLLSLALGYTTALDQRLVSYQRDRLTALYLAKAGYRRALVELERDPLPHADSYLDSWARNPEAFRQAPLGPGSFTVSYALPGQDRSAGVVYGIVDEDRKININTAPKAILAKLPGMTEVITEALLEWRAKHKSLVVIEDRPFKVLEELWLVDGMTPEVFQALEPFVTVYSDGKVNLNTAPGEVLTALGMSEGLVTKVLRFRGLDGIQGAPNNQSFTTLASAGQELNAFETLTPLEAAQLSNLITQNRCKVASSVFRIHARGTVRDGKISRAVEGVVRRGAGPSRPVALLSWHES